MKHQLKQSLKGLITSKLPYASLLKVSHAKPRILMYHGVSPIDPITPAIFEQQLEVIKHYFAPVPLNKIDPYKQNTTSPQVALTFDDGLKNNADYVLPLLIKHDVPATFFICSALTGGGHMLWNHELRARLNRLSPEKRQEIFQSRSPIEDHQITHAVNQLKSRTTSFSLSMLNSVRKITPNFRPTEFERTRFELMDTTTVKTLPDLIEIGCHTRHHFLLNQMATDQLPEEIIDARRELEQLASREISSFCYPNGLYNQAAVALVESTYKRAVTALPGYVSESTSPFKLPRVCPIPDLNGFLLNLLRPKY